MRKFILAILLFSSINLFAVESKLSYNPKYIDSVLTNSSNDSLYSYSISAVEFKNKNNSIANAIEIPRTNRHLPFDYLAILLLLITTLIVKFFYYNYFIAALPSFISLKAYQQNYFLKKIDLIVPNIWVFLLRILGWALIIHQAIFYYNNQKVIGIAWIVLFCLIFFLSKILLESFINYLSGNFNLYRIHFFQKQIIQSVVLIICLPLILALLQNHSYYNKYLFITLLIIIILQSLYVYIRWLQLLKIESPYKILHFFIYFCAVKILPLLLISKWASKIFR
jgi:hypothetical protein